MTCDVNSYDALLDRAILDGARIAPRFGIFASGAPLGWRIASTEPDGELTVILRDDITLFEAKCILVDLRMAVGLEMAGRFPMEVVPCMDSFKW